MMWEFYSLVVSSVRYISLYSVVIVPYSLGDMYKLNERIKNERCWFMSQYFGAIEKTYLRGYFSFASRTSCKSLSASRIGRI
jgi:hypothetical protein